MPRKSSSSSPSAKRRLNFEEETDDKHLKRNQRDNDHGNVVPPAESSSASQSTSTSHLIDGTPQKKKARVDSYFSPASRKSTKASAAAAVVTPEKIDGVADDQDKKKESQDTTAYVPIYIHKNLNYQRRGQASLSSVVQQTFDLVEEYYVIPKDFETNRKYGPLSGTCFEERAINAYNEGWLHSKKEGEDDYVENAATTAVEICSHCAVTGHRRDDCLELI
jgi:hypothetical protein